MNDTQSTMRLPNARIACCIAALLLCATAMAQGGIAPLVPMPPDTAPSPLMWASNVYLHVLSTGQSISAGYNTAPAISTSQPYSNLSLHFSPGGYSAPLVPLAELPGEETPSSGIANTLHALDTMQRRVIVSLHGVPGYGYDSLRKGSHVWDVAMLQVATAKAEVHAIDSTASYLPIGVTVIHGETDYFIHNSGNYQAHLEEWQRDYQHDINLIMGHPYAFPMFVSQMNAGWSPELALAQYAAHKDNPRKIVLVGPKYQYTHQADHMHLLTNESLHLGEMLGKVMHAVVMDHKPWRPLMPTGVWRTDSVITVDYHIPVGKLAIDTVMVARRPAYGFEFLQAGGNAVGIARVELVNNETQVRITLDGIPTGSDQRLRYACNCYHSNTVITWCGGRLDSTAVGGNIRDTDSLPSPAIGSSGLPLHDWGVAFEEPVVQVLVAAQGPAAAQVEVFPNPTRGSLHVRSRGGAEGLGAMSLLDLAGREAMAWAPEPGATEAVLDLSALPAGIYVLRASTAGQTDAVFRVVVE